jgi:hypothetical protein
MDTKRNTNEHESGKGPTVINTDERGQDAKWRWIRLSTLRVLAGVLVLPLYLVVSSLSVPPNDLPLYGIIFLLAICGLAVAHKEDRGWRIFRGIVLVLSVAFGTLEVLAGKRIARLRSVPPSSSHVAAVCLAA